MVMYESNLLYPTFRKQGSSFDVKYSLENYFPFLSLFFFPDKTNFADDIYLQTLRFGKPGH